MSFSFNGPSFRPMIQESQSMKNNGGGGNTGYFQRGKKKKNKEIDVFGDNDKDEFVLKNTEEEDIVVETGFLNKIVEKTKDLIQKVNETSVSKNPFKME